MISEEKGNECHVKCLKFPPSFSMQTLVEVLNRFLGQTFSLFLLAVRLTVYGTLQVCV